jgi:hypothetical protein
MSSPPRHQPLATDRKPDEYEEEHAGQRAPDDVHDPSRLNDLTYRIGGRVSKQRKEYGQRYKNSVNAAGVTRGQWLQSPGGDISVLPVSRVAGALTELLRETDLRVP